MHRLAPTKANAAISYKLKAHQGFTLIELLIYLGIVAIVLAIASTLVYASLQARVRRRSIAVVEQEGLRVTELISFAARNSRGITSPPPGATGTTLTLSTDATSSTPTIFSLATGTIRITEGTGTPIALTSNRVAASALVFTNLTPTSTPGTIRFSFKLDAVAPTGRGEYGYGRVFTSSASRR